MSMASQRMLAARYASSGGAQQPQFDHSRQPTHQNQQMMMEQSNQNQQVVSGPFIMMVPGSAMPSGSIPMMPVSADQWNRQAQCGYPAAGALEAFSSDSMGDLPSLDAGGKQLGGKRVRRKQRLTQGVGACDAAADEELEQMRAAVGDMLRLQQSGPGVHMNFNTLKAVARDVQDRIPLKNEIMGSAEHGVFSCDTLPSMASMDSNIDVLSDSDSGENDFVDKSEADGAFALLSSGRPEDHREVFDWITSSADSVWLMAASRNGTRIIQKAFDVFGLPEKAVLADGIRGHVQDALESPHANHVLQKLVESMPPQRICFVIEEMLGLGAYFARRRFGCRVVERLLENCSSADLAMLTEEILQDAEKLCRHPYGNFVIQHLLQHGTKDQKHTLAMLLRDNIIRLARHRNASHVVEAAFVHCSPTDKQELMAAMESNEGDLFDLSRTRCGSFVVRDMMGTLPVTGGRDVIRTRC